MPNVSSIKDGVFSVPFFDGELQHVGVIVFSKNPVVSPTYLNLGRPLKSCDIILYIEILTRLPILPASP